MRSASGRSSRSTLMATKCRFISAAMASSSKDSRSITWHQWQGEEPMGRKIGFASPRALFNAPPPPGIPIHGVVGVLQEIGALFVDQPVGMHVSIHAPLGTTWEGVRRQPPAGQYFYHSP